MYIQRYQYGIIMFYFIVVENEKLYILEVIDNVGCVLKGKDMNDHILANYHYGDVIPEDVIVALYTNAKHFMTTIVSELTHKKADIEVYSTKSYNNCYQVVTNGIIRHPNVDADSTIRVITHYASCM